MRRYPKAKKFFPKNPEKYVGDVNNIVCRSGIEYRYFKFFDENSSIVKYSSEEVIIPYVSPIDKKVHRYFPDFMIQVKTKDGKLKNFLIEIKPSSDLIEPKAGKKTTKRLLSEMVTWETNKAKWESAKKFAKKHNMDFLVMTEKTIALNFNSSKNNGED